MIERRPIKNELPVEAARTYVWTSLFAGRQNVLSLMQRWYCLDTTNGNFFSLAEKRMRFESVLFNFNEIISVAAAAIGAVRTDDCRREGTFDARKPIKMKSRQYLCSLTFFCVYLQKKKTNYRANLSIFRSFSPLSSRLACFKSSIRT